MILNINNKEFLVNYIQILGLDRGIDVKKLEVNQLQDLLSGNGIKLEYYSNDITQNTNQEQLKSHDLSEYYDNLYKMQKEKIIEYESTINDRTSELYWQMYSELDIYETLKNGYKSGELTTILTKDEAIEYTKNKIEEFKQRCPYWKDYEKTRLKFIELEKTVSWESDEFKTTKQKLEQLEYLVANWSEDDEPVVRDENKDQNMYRDAQIQNGYASKFLNKTSISLNGSSDLLSTHNNKFSLSLGGNMSLNHTISDNQENFNENINSASFSANITARGNIAGVDTSVSVDRTYMPDFTQGNIHSSSSINVMAMRSINSKLFLNGNYSMNYADNNISHNISVEANSQITDTSSISFNYSHLMAEEMNSNTYTLSANFRTPDNKVNISGGVSYTEGEKTPSIFLNGKIKF